MSFTKYNYGEQINEGEMGGAWSTHGSNEKFKHHFSNQPEGTDNLGNLDVDGRITRKCIFKTRV
jgi:hypothetical protein